MIIKLDKEAKQALIKRLETDEMAEQIGENDYVLDLYDFDPPVTMELEFCKDGVDVLACEKLEFSEEMDGWYVSGRIKDAEVVARALAFKPEGSEND